MDAFKGQELARMSAGGNKPFQDFFNAHASNVAEHRTFDGCGIGERYDSEAGDEWKERLSCKVEGRTFDPNALPKRAPKQDKTPGAGAPLSGRASAPTSRSQTPLSKTRSGDGALPPRSGSPALGTASLARKTQNDAYFARMGQENATRREDLPPSQGGKYAGFGSQPPDPAHEDLAALPRVDDFQKDPVAALTKGFGWLGATVGKGAKTGYDGWVRPGMQKVGYLAFPRRRARLIAPYFVSAGRRRHRCPGTHYRVIAGPKPPTGHCRGGNCPDPLRRGRCTDGGAAVCAL